MPISPNTTISQYTIVSKLGEGSMGELWRTRDSSLDGVVQNWAADKK